MSEGVPPESKVVVHKRVPEVALTAVRRPESAPSDGGPCPHIPIMLPSAETFMSVPSPCGEWKSVLSRGRKEVRRSREQST
eukprot:3973219-Prymnesium_polylepis.1